MNWFPEEILSYELAFYIGYDNLNEILRIDGEKGYHDTLNERLEEIDAVSKVDYDNGFVGNNIYLTLTEKAYTGEKLNEINKTIKQYILEKEIE